MKIFKSVLKPNFKPYNNPHVKIEYAQQFPGNAVNELYYAQDVIGNYAKEKGAKVRFFNPSELLGETDSLMIENKLSSRVGIEASRKGTLPRVTTVDYFKTEKEPFLRQVYRAVENLLKGKE